MESQNMEVRKMVSKTNRFLLERIMLLQPWRVRGAKTIAGRVVVFGETTREVQYPSFELSLHAA